MIIGRRRRAALLTALAAAASSTGCSSLGPGSPSAAAVAQSFHRAVSDAQGSQACSLLAPGTVAEVEQAAGSSCAQAILDEKLPNATSVGQVDVDGRAALVVLRGDAVFLSVFGGSWKVTAAGCSPRQGQPYDCTVKGG